jgi:hypothetical protein
VFVATWIIAVAVWRLARIERRRNADLQTQPAEQ